MKGRMNYCYWQIDGSRSSPAKSAARAGPLRTSQSKSLEPSWNSSHSLPSYLYSIFILPPYSKHIHTSWLTQLLEVEVVSDETDEAVEVVDEDPDEVVRKSKNGSPSLR